MKGTKYLSELVDISDLRTDELNIIEAPTGSGKSYFALHHIPSLVDDPYHKIIYLIDTRNGKEQLIDNYEVATPDYWRWFDEIFSSDVVHSETVVVMTYAKFGVYCSIDSAFPSCFEYIICDELPSLIKYQYFSERPNNHSIAREHLEKAVKNGKTKVIALTATPQRLKHFKATKYIVPINKDELIQYDIDECVPFTKIDNVIADIDDKKTGMCYTSRISAMIEIERKAKERGLRPICIWSTANAEHPMTEEQLSVRESILKEFVLPEKYNFLIINSSSETSIKIKSKIDYVIVNNTDVDTQVQVRGRVNNDLEKIYLPFKVKGSGEITIPPEFIGKKLFAEDKEALCNFFGLTNQNGRPWKWPHTRDIMIDLGYHCEQGRQNNLRYAIFTLKE